MTTIQYHSLNNLVGAICWLIEIYLLYNLASTDRAVMISRLKERWTIYEGKIKINFFACSAWVVAATFLIFQYGFASIDKITNVFLVWNVATVGLLLIKELETGLNLRSYCVIYFTRFNFVLQASVSTLYFVSW